MGEKLNKEITDRTVKNKEMYDDFRFELGNQRKFTDDFFEKVFFLENFFNEKKDCDRVESRNHNFAERDES